MLNKLLGQVPDASEHGYLIDHMLEFCHWFMLVLFVGWFVFFITTLFRFHRSRNPKADYHGIQGHLSTHIEVSVVLVEAVLLIGFGLPLWGNRVTEESFPDKAEALRVHAVGEQFAWNFHYAGPDGVFGRQSMYLVGPNNPLGLDNADPAAQDDVISKNELHLTNYRPTVIEVTSKDVIHSLSLHSMRITQDGTPGSRVPVWFRPKKVGSYEIVCAQLCGAGHFAMRADMMVEEKKDFDAWYKETAALQHPTASVK
jgi:cytochrome c oxidase subunit 2